MIRILWGKEAKLWPHIRAEYAKVEVQLEAAGEQRKLFERLLQEARQEKDYFRVRADTAINALLAESGKPALTIPQPTERVDQDMFAEDPAAVEAMRRQLADSPETVWSTE